MAHQVGHAGDEGARRAETLQPRRREVCPDPIVPDEVAVGERRRLADVVQQGGGARQRQPVDQGR